MFGVSGIGPPVTVGGYEDRCLEYLLVRFLRFGVICAALRRQQRLCAILLWEDRSCHVSVAYMDPLAPQRIPVVIWEHLRRLWA